MNRKERKEHKEKKALVGVPLGSLRSLRLRMMFLAFQRQSLSQWSFKSLDGCTKIRMEIELVGNSGFNRRQRPIESKYGVFFQHVPEKYPESGKSV